MRLSGTGCISAGIVKVAVYTVWMHLLIMEKGAPHTLKQLVTALVQASVKIAHPSMLSSSSYSSPTQLNTLRALVCYMLLCVAALPPTAQGV